MILHMFVAVTIIAGADGKPQINTYPQDIMSRERCLEKKANLESMPPKLIDPVTDRPLLSNNYECVPMDTDLMLSDIKRGLEQAQKEGAAQ